MLQGEQWDPRILQLSVPRENPYRKKHLQLDSNTPQGCNNRTRSNLHLHQHHQTGSPASTGRHHHTSNHSHISSPEPVSQITVIFTARSIGTSGHPVGPRRRKNSRTSPTVSRLSKSLSKDFQYFLHALFFLLRVSHLHPIHPTYISHPLLVLPDHVGARVFVFPIPQPKPPIPWPKRAVG